RRHGHRRLDPLRKLVSDAFGEGADGGCGSSSIFDDVILEPQRLELPPELFMKLRRLPDTFKPSTLAVEWVVGLKHPKNPDGALVSGTRQDHRCGIGHDSFAGENGNTLSVPDAHLDHELSFKFCLVMTRRFRNSAKRHEDLLDNLIQ